MFDIYNPIYRENFFKEAGEVVDVRFSSYDDGTFKGYGHVEFASPEEAQKVTSYLLFWNHGSGIEITMMIGFILNVLNAGIGTEW